MVKKNSLRLLAAFAAFPLMFFVACDDSSSASNEEPVKSSSSESTPESSSAPGSSSDPEACDNEGAVDSLMAGNAKYGYSYTYYRCEQGKRVQRPQWVSCDTTGVKKGDLCRVQSTFSGFQFGSDVWTCYKYAGEGSWDEADCHTGPKKECNEENEGVVESVAESHFEQSLGTYEDNFYYMCVKGKWTSINGALAKCTTAETKVGDECCNVGYSTFKVTYPSHSILYKYTEDGWALQGVYSDLECKEFSYDPADSCSVPAEACTEDGNNKIDSTLKSAKTSATCYSLCLNNEWKRLVIDDVKVYAHCGEPKEEGENRCCYTPPAEITEQYPWYGSAIYVYDYLFGWAVSEYYGAPNCEDPAE